MEFVAASVWLQQAARCISFDCPAAAGGRMSDAPAAILVLESRPGEFCAADVERLHAVFPLARLVALVGPWCEGPQRSSGRLHGVSRVRWCDWESRLAGELGLTRDGRSSAPPLPRTITEAERIDRDVLAVKPANRNGSRVTICTGSRASFQAIADAADQLGFAAQGKPHRSGTQLPACDAIIYDGWEQADALTATPRVLILHFPRPEDFSRAASLGIGAVVAQPMLLSDFATALERAMCPARA